MLNFKKFKILTEMTRPHGMITPLCACFSGLYLANGEFPYFSDIIESFIIIILLWSGGVIMNDYYDFKVDSITDPDRPIPSGKITRKEVLSISIFLFSIAFILSLLISIKLSFITASIIILTIGYDSTFKKWDLIGSLSFGIIESLSFTIGIFKIGFNEVILLSVVLIMTSIIFFHTSINIIGAIRHTEADKKTGNLTVPAKYGIDNAIKLAILFLLLSSIIAYIPAILNLLNYRYIPNLFITDLWLIIITFMLKHDIRLGYMAFGMYYMGGSIVYLNFITGI